MYFTYFKDGVMSDVVTEDMKLPGIEYYELPAGFDAKEDTASLANGKLVVLWRDKAKKREQLLQDEAIQELVATLKRKIRVEIIDKKNVGSIEAQLTGLTDTCLALDARLRVVEELLGIDYEMNDIEKRNHAGAKKLIEIKRKHKPKLDKFKACKTVEEAEQVRNG